MLIQMHVRIQMLLKPSQNEDVACCTQLHTDDMLDDKHTCTAKSTLKLPTDVRYGVPPLTFPETLISLSELRAALNLLLLVPRATVMEVSTSLQCP